MERKLEKNKKDVDPEMLAMLELLMDFEVLEEEGEWNNIESMGENQGEEGE